MANELDAYLRQQVYVEGTKLYVENSFDETYEAVELAVALIVAKIGYDKVSELSKTQLLKLVSLLENKLSVIFNRTVRVSSSLMKKFMTADISVTKTIAAALSGKAKSKFMVAANRLWATINNAPIGGVGQEPKNIMTTFVSSAGSKIVSKFKQAWAEGWTLNELRNNIIGTSNQQYKNGILRNIRNNFNAAIATWMQHITSFVSQAVNSLFYDRYQWVSVMDGRTTPICIERNGNVYEYGNGPKPPAHYRCRSRTIPLMAEVALPMPTFDAWFKEQPVEVQRDLKQYSAPAQGGGPVGRIKALSIDDYKKKVNMMLTNIVKKG